MDSVTKLRSEIEQLQRSHDPDYEFYGVLLDVTEGIVKQMIGQNVRRSELATRLGTSRAYVTKLLDGQENMTLKTLVRVANALDMKVHVRLEPRRAAVRATKRTPASPAHRKAPTPAKPPARRKASVAARSRKH